MKLLAYDISGVQTSDGTSLSAMLRGLGVHVTEAQQTTKIEMGDYDALLFYATGQFQHPYVIALSLAQQKPIVFLLPKGASLPEAVSALRQDKQISKLIHVKHTSPATLERDMRDVLNTIEQGVLKEIPSIKFTLRITPTIERYLQWKSQQTGLSKADVLREFIEKDLIAKDEQFPRT